MKIVIIILLALIAAAGLITFLVLMLRPKCPAGRRFDANLNKCVIVCKPDETYDAGSDSCRAQPCADDEILCANSCVSADKFKCACKTDDGKLDFKCSAPVPIPLSSICSNSVCADDEKCISEKCVKCDTMCKNVCCQDNELCTASGCCPSSLVRKDGSCCPEELWSDSEEKCCSADSGKLGDKCRCGSGSCSNTQQCNTFMDGNIKNYYCKNNECKVNWKQYEPDYDARVCSNGQGMLRYCDNSNSSNNSVSPVLTKSKTDLTCSDNGWCRAEQLTLSLECAEGDCANFANGAEQINFNESIKSCSALYTCSSSCDDVQKPENIGEYRFCKDKNNAYTGEFCETGTCIDGQCKHFKCSVFGNCEPVNDSKYLETCVSSVCEIPEKTYPVQIQHNMMNQTTLCVAIDNNGNGSFKSCDIDDPDQVFYLFDTGEPTTGCNVNDDKVGTWFMLKRRDGRCLDCSNALASGSWSWVNYDPKNPWTQYSTIKSTNPNSTIEYAITTRGQPYCINMYNSPRLLSTNGSSVYFQVGAQDVSLNYFLNNWTISKISQAPADTLKGRGT